MHAEDDHEDVLDARVAAWGLEVGREYLIVATCRACGVELGRRALPVQAINRWVFFSDAEVAAWADHRCTP